MPKVFLVDTFHVHRAANNVNDGFDRDQPRSQSALLRPSSPRFRNRLFLHSAIGLSALAATWRLDIPILPNNHIFSNRCCCLLHQNAQFRCLLNQSSFSIYKFN